MAVETAVQLEPHRYPVGQQPPPTVSAQLNHPLAHRPILLLLLLLLVAAVAVPVAVITGTTIVTPSLAIVVEGVAGQDVVSQSRPVRQHPPW